MSTYRIRKAEYNPLDPSTFIEIDELGADTLSTDLVFAGKVRAQYGLDYNENMLHLLENFASPEADFTADLLDTDGEGLSHAFLAVPKYLTSPVDGQTWFNNTRKVMYQYFRGRWTPLLYKSDVGTRHGHVCHGETVPLPAGFTSFRDCSVTVSPMYIPTNIEASVCSVDGDGLVTCTYTPVGGSPINGVASFLIVGIKGNAELNGERNGSRFIEAPSLAFVTEQVPAYNTLPQLFYTDDDVQITADAPEVGNSITYEWRLLNPEAFPAGYSIQLRNASNDALVALDTQTTVDNVKFSIAISSSGVFNTTQRIRRSATFICHVRELDGLSNTVREAVTLPIRVEFYNY